MTGLHHNCRTTGLPCVHLSVAINSTGTTNEESEDSATSESAAAAAAAAVASDQTAADALPTLPVNARQREQVRTEHHAMFHSYSQFIQFQRADKSENTHAAATSWTDSWAVASESVTSPPLHEYQPPKLDPYAGLSREMFEHFMFGARQGIHRPFQPSNGLIHQDRLLSPEVNEYFMGRTGPSNDQSNQENNQQPAMDSTRQPMQQPTGPRNVMRPDMLPGQVQGPVQSMSESSMNASMHPTQQQTPTSQFMQPHNFTTITHQVPWLDVQPPQNIPSFGTLLNLNNQDQKRQQQSAQCNSTNVPQAHQQPAFNQYSNQMHPFEHHVQSVLLNQYPYNPKPSVSHLIVEPPHPFLFKYRYLPGIGMMAKPIQHTQPMQPPYSQSTFNPSHPFNDPSYMPRQHSASQMGQSGMSQPPMQQPQSSFAPPAQHTFMPPHQSNNPSQQPALSQMGHNGMMQAPVHKPYSQSSFAPPPPPTQPSTMNQLPAPYRNQYEMNTSGQKHRQGNIYPMKPGQQGVPPFVQQVSATTQKICDTQTMPTAMRQAAAITPPSVRLFDVGS